MRAISQSRWEALVAYCREPLAATMMRELAWFEADNEKIVATLILDTDQEYSGIILARDYRERYRWVAATSYFDNPEEALIALYKQVQDILPNLDAERAQGDESGPPVDFFKPVVAEERLHPHFRILASGGEFSAARAIINVMMRWHEDIDGNFVEQFQTTGFDARMWELYLFAALTEANLKVSRPKAAPDFVAQGLDGEFAMEATTINPSIGDDGKPYRPPMPQTDEDRKAYLLHYLPIRYAGPLTGKLKKEYWTVPAATGKPLIFAIQDFHGVMSMTYSWPALPTYLYGLIHEAARDNAGKLSITVSPIVEHKWDSKVVPSNFFSLPGAENVSAVVFNSGGTIAKFNRMGVSAGFGEENVVLVRRGTAWNPDPDAATPISFIHIVSEGYPENWIGGMDVYHNPNAVHPLDPDLLPGAAHHRLLPDGQIETTSAGWKPMESTTSIVTFSPQTEEAMTIDDATAESVPSRGDQSAPSDE